MSYKALYRKYRPMSFVNVLGQDHIISTLKNVIESNKISHAYLFAGPRGTGKTSVAHIFAREINKYKSEDFIKDSLDIVEIDAASNNGVAEIRNLISKSNYAPSNSKYKIYIIDEVHMLTHGAFNALLKTLEEPPSHLIFILATTEPHKIPITILSRTQRFNFRRISDTVILQQLRNILEVEKITFEEEALKFIAKLAQGGMRDALSIADQSASYGNDNISFLAISQVFGIISIKNQIKILKLAFNNQPGQLLLLTSQFIENGIDFERLTSSLMDILKDIIVFKKTNDTNLLETITIEDISQTQFTTEFIYKSLDVLLKLLSDLRFSLIPKQIFELSILKLINTKVNKNNLKNSTNILETNKIEINKKSFENNDISLIQKEIVKEKEEINLTKEIENDILSTQEITLDDSKKEQKSDDINLVSYFKNNESPEGGSQVNNDISITDEIINYLVQANKEKALFLKNKLPDAMDFIDSKKNDHFATIFRKMKFISGGEGFMIVSSEDDDAITRIDIEKDNQNFIDFTSELFGEALYIVAITKEQFKKVKEKWKKLSDENNLPKPKPIKKVSPTPKEKTNAEKLGEDLFGDLFN